ncbi:hypothetical protein TIFTF001_021569 [Ficus carica]|uniref:MADS-box domain-containing protein n=1 Tax=Ficus carica TaxID=3494 RepID=A0AA88DER5_FICCA|nr:hypothetical protein TIFTF001_021569 [Ficus carica]
MAKIPKQSNLQVTFSKRRSGLFKKASELCTLCGVEIAMIVFSPANKAFSFGHPAVDSVVNRFLTSQRNSSINFTVIESRSNSNHVVIHELNEKITLILGQLDAEKRKGQVLDDDHEKRRSKCWWESPVDELSLSELELLKASLEEVKNSVNLTKQAHKIASDHQISTARFPQHFMMNGGRSSDGVFDNKPMDALAAPASTSTLRDAHNFGFGNKIFLNFP